MAGGYLYDDRDGTFLPLPVHRGAPTRGDEAVVFTGQQLILFGGSDQDPGQEGSLGGVAVTPTNRGWILALPSP